MPNFISEDDIEQATLDRLKHHGYHTLNCYTPKPETLNDQSHRTDKRDVIFRDRLRTAAIALNPEIPPEAIDTALKQLCDRRQTQNAIDANRELDNLIRDGIPIEYKKDRSSDRRRTKRDRVRVIDFDRPENNQFLAVSQLWIQSTGTAATASYRRPDILIYINGLPLVFIELKNANRPLRTAYDDNLINYKHDIPQLFLTNALCILSNAIETRLGSYTATWEYFFQWLRPEDETEKIDRQQIRDTGTSLDRLIDGLLAPAKLLDYLENFILYNDNPGKTQKIIAQNHQFIGVNKGFEKFQHRAECAGKLGVFWHTQGSGKSYSMIFYARKIFRKCTGNYSFVVVTDREDLDGQIYKTFLHTNTVSKANAAQPKDSQQLRDFLSQNKRLIFTLIHKFRYDKGEKYPLLSDRNDIIVIVDEAHRTQYKTLAENMRAGLPNAQYLAFTGTPLLGRDRKTNEWFGDYVSEYNFSQSMDDGATVPLFYNKRVPEVTNQNEDLSDEFNEIIEDENLSEAQQEKLERQFSTTLAIIKRDDRLEAIARDIVYHFPRRGYLGKAMAIAVDKFTAVKLYDKVQRLWKAELKQLRGHIKHSTNDLEKKRLKHRLDYMRDVEMAVVVSAENGEAEKFTAQGLDIRPHRDRMIQRDIEAEFKDPNHPLQLVFVCAMWLTGFDAPTISTLYLDKPQKGHTLMQTIARANRVTSHRIHGIDKKNGEIVDYYGVFGRLKQAVKDYGQGSDGLDAVPVQDKTALFALLDEAIARGRAFLSDRHIDIDTVLTADNISQNLHLCDSWANTIIVPDESRRSFKVFENTITALYEACKPEILGRPIVRQVALFQYLRGILDGLAQRQDIDLATQKINELLDESIVVNSQQFDRAKAFTDSYQIQKRGKVWDLSQIDFEKLQQEFRQTTYKNIAIADLRAFLEAKLAQMLTENRTRRAFADRLQNIIENYNAQSSDADTNFEELVKFAATLREEGDRHIRLGLTEDELEIYDLLCTDKLTKADEKKVRLAAKALLQRLTAAQPKILVQDWYKDSQTRTQVRNAVDAVLDEHLPEESYDQALFFEKRDKVFDLTLDLAINRQKWAA
ncbi:type I restriction endonuclease subunit R [Spirulina major]|uniref:type I restriction endonuclease subunit R n=1 Tax=Spirulina major TaxID=270636 RepID=UPI000932B275|nr:type I restriction endonuclease subunit R [Spirulina major]